MKNRITWSASFILIVLLFPFGKSGRVLAQSIGINATGSAPKASAILDVDATPANDKGVLVPRMTTAQRNAISTPANGLMIYNITCEEFNYYNAKLTPPAWVPLNNLGALATPGAITGNISPCQSTINIPYTIATVPNATGYLWKVPAGATISGGQGTTSITVNFGTKSGNICVVAGNPCGDSSFPSCINITLDSAVSGVKANSTPNPICTGGTLYLLGNATNATSWLWSGPNSYSSNLQNPVLANTTTVNAGAYTLTASNVCGSAPSASTSVVVDVITPITASYSPNPICQGSTLSLLGSGTIGTTNWKWTGPNTFKSFSQDTSLTSVTPTVSGVYTLNATDACGAATAATTTVTVDPAPVATAATNLNVATTSFTANWNAATGATSYSLDVSMDAAFSAAGAVLTNQTVTGTGYSVSSALITCAGTYYYRVRSNACVTAANSNVVEVIMPPCTYTYVNGDQTYTVPAGRTWLAVKMWGAGGGSGCGGAGQGGGGGGYSSDTLIVTPLETFTVVVGAGGTGTETVGVDWAGGYGGGGTDGQHNSTGWGSAGGGMAALVGPTVSATVIAGGGGGASCGFGGAGGGAPGDPGSGYCNWAGGAGQQGGNWDGLGSGGAPGAESSGVATAPGTSGTAWTGLHTGIGGKGIDYASGCGGGGGGGGYGGGGGGGGGGFGGAGGGGYAPGANGHTISGLLALPGNSADPLRTGGAGQGGLYSAGGVIQGGNGLVIITQVQ